MNKRLAIEVVNEYTRGYNDAQKEHLIFIMVHDNLCLFDAIELESNELHRLAFVVTN